MPPIEHFIHRFNQQVWQGVEKAAYHHPHASRLLAFPIAMVNLIKSIFIPLKAVEEIVLAAKSIKAYKTEQNPNLAPLKQEAMMERIAHAIICIGLTPFSPLVGIIAAVRGFVKVGFSPFKTAKINAALHNFFLFSKNEARYSEIKNATTFANETAFARTVLNRFTDRVSKARNHEELKNLHFLDEENSKTQLINEVALKALKLQEAKRTYQRYRSVNPLSERTIQGLNKSWKDFQNQLIKATEEETSRLTFAPVLHS